MIYVIFGNDTRRSRDLLREFEVRFAREVPHAYQVIDCEEDGAEMKIERDVGSSSLFGTKDYCIIRHASTLSLSLQSVLQEVASRWQHDDSVAVFYERGVPEKNDFFDFLQKAAHKKQEFKELSSGELLRFLEGELKKRSASLSPDEKEAVLVASGGNLWRLEAELEKKLLGGEVERISSMVDDKELFTLSDLWGRRERERAILLYTTLLRAGFEAPRILSTLLWHIKTLFLVGKKEIKGIHPYVVRKSSGQIKNFTPEALEKAYMTLITYDADDKRGVGNVETGILHFLLTQ